MKHLYFLYVLLLFPFTALLASGKTQPPPFDADLFRKNVQTFSLHGEFLFWQIQEGALDYALSMKQQAWGDTACFASGNYQSAQFNGDPGFRIGASFFRAPKYWEVKAQYTRLVGFGKNEATKPSEPLHFLTGTWPQVFSAPMASATSVIYLQYNVADLWADRVFHPNPHLRMRLLSGPTVAWINQKWKITYSNAASQKTDVVNKWGFVGAGLRLGSIIDWFWTSDIYITGGATLAGFLGSYQNTSKQTVNFQPTPNFNPSLPLRDSKLNDTRPAFAAQFFMGPSYQKNFTHKRIEVFVGYELNAWLNLQEISRSSSGSPSEAKETWLNTSMLALQGLTSRLTVDF